MRIERFDDAISEAQDLLALARQHQTDGEAQEAEANVVWAVVTLERLLPPPETDES